MASIETATFSPDFADQQETFLRQLQILHSRETNREVPFVSTSDRPPVRTARILAGKQAVESLYPAWHELLRTTASSEFYHQPEWTASLLPLFEDSQILTYIEELDGELSAIVPLLKTAYPFAGIPLKSISLLHNGYTPYTDYVLRIDAEASGLASRLTAALKRTRITWDLLHFPNIAPHSHAARDLTSDSSGMNVVQHKRLCDYLRAEPYETRLKQFSQNFRGNLRKARNKLAELPDIRIEWHRELPELKRAFPEFLQVEAAGWKWMEGTSILQSAQARSFYEQLIEQFGPHGQCGIHLLKQGSQPLAGQFALYQGSVCSLIKIGYDESFAKLAPGNMLLEALLKRHQGQDEIREINLISGLEWHRNWKPHSIPISNHFLFNLTSRALLAYSLHQGKRWTESFKHSSSDSEETNHNSNPR